MDDYRSFLRIKIQHDYYNQSDDSAAPFTLSPDSNTNALLRQYGILMRSKPGHIQMIVNATTFPEMAELTQGFILRFFLTSADPVARSITKMPHPFDVATLNVEFNHGSIVEITADGWTGMDNIDEGAVNLNKNIIGVLTVTLPKSQLTLDEKHLTVRFHAVATYWKYYLFSVNSKKNLRVSCSLPEECLFIEQESEEFAGRKVRVFLSDREIPARKRPMLNFTLSDDTKIIVKSLPVSTYENTSIHLIDKSEHIISHIYIN
ncbi:TPA: hypothetical protein QCG56_004130 [Enterobacter cancerogenus]|nr:hypothetical protein [Enterobacter cancerogenus]HDR2167223.1 hypothetical protein [Enterobacter cancerogenus]HDR2269805.1 hypothetical protein [Enterobacter cancerogenus]